MTDPDPREGRAVEEACGCKVGRSAAKYGADDLDRALRRRRAEGASLRDLESFVNARLLGAAVDATDATVAGDPASIYAALTDDGVSTDRRVRVQDRLADVGLDLDELEADFVSYQTVRTHLRDCLGMDTGRSGVETVEEGRGVVERVRDRDREIIERTLARLRRRGALGIGDVTVTVAVTVECGQCGRSHRLRDLLDEGGCDCHDGG